MSTFKAKIISNDLYHEYKRLGIFGSIVLSVGITLSTEILPLGSLAQVVLFVAIAMFSYQSLKMQRTMQNLLNRQRIEITGEAIKTIDQNNIVSEQINICNAKEIIVDDRYTYAEDSAGAFWKMIAKKPLSNNLTIKSKNKEYRYQFLIESHYMAVQIDKIISGWKREGYQVVTFQETA